MSQITEEPNSTNKIQFGDEVPVISNENSLTPAPATSVPEAGNGDVVSVASNLQNDGSSDKSIPEPLAITPRLVSPQTEGNRLYAFGTWNTQTLNGIGKLETLLSEIERYNIKILAVQETRWTESDIFDYGDFTIYRSSGTKKEFGVAFIIHKDLADNVIDFSPINNRICLIRLNIDNKDILTLINVHAPTNEKDDLTKDNFYKELDSIYDSVPNSDIKIILGDFNAQVGQEDEYRETTGAHSLHALSNDNGKRTIKFAEDKDLKIRSTYFKRKDIHKMTWKFNQIDHVLIQSRSARYITDIKSRREANCDTDHFLVTIKFRSNFITKSTEPETFKLSTPEYRQSCEEALTKFNTNLDKDDTTVEEQWTKLKNHIDETVRQVIGDESNERSDEWFDEECKILLEQKRKAYLACLQAKMEYKKLKDQTEETFRHKWGDYINDQLNNIDSNSKQKYSRRVLDLSNYFEQGFIPSHKYIGDDDVLLTSDPDKVNRIWKTHFHDSFNTSMSTENETNRQVITSTHDEDVTLEEVKEALNAIENGTDSGFDNIPGVLFKNSDSIENQLHKILYKIWKEEKLPDDWTKAITQPIYKYNQGNNMDCKNYTEISIPSTAYKVFSYILRSRILIELKDGLGEYQRCSPNEQVFVVRRTMDKFYEYNKALHQIFVHFKPDSFDKNRVYEIMNDFKIPGKLICLTKMALKNTFFSGRTHFGTTDELRATAELKNGDELSPILLSIALEYVIRRLGIDHSKTIFQQKNQILAYADVVNIISKDQNSASKLLKKLKKASMDVGLQINNKKTKYMRMTRAAPLPNTPINGIDTVDRFEYLGSIINNKGTEDDEIERCISEAEKMYNLLLNILKTDSISKENKIKIYKTLVRPVLTDGSESWTIKRVFENRLKQIERKMLLQIFGLANKTGIWKKVYDLYQDDNVFQFIQLNKQQWVSYVDGMEGHRFPKQAMNGQLEGKRPVGSPRKRYEDTIMEAEEQI